MLDADPKDSIPGYRAPPSGTPNELSARIFEEASALMVVLDLEGRVVHANPFCERLTGYRLDELQGRRWFDELMAEPGRAEARAKLEAMASTGGGACALSHPLTSRSGEVRQVTWTGSLLRNPRGESELLLIGLDVLARPVGSPLPVPVNAVSPGIEHVQLSETMLREVQHLAKLGTWELAADTQAMRWNQEMFRIFEIQPETFQGSYDTIWKAIHPDDRATVEGAFRSSIANRAPYELIHRVLTSDGRIKWIHARGQTHYAPDGRPLRTVGSAQDVTAQVEARLRLRHLIDGMFVFVCLLDLDGSILDVNRAPLELAGMKREEVLGKPFWATPWFPQNPALRAQLQEAVARARDGEPVRSDCVIRVKEGREATLDAMFSHVRDANGKVEAIIASAVDVTERRQAEVAALAHLKEKETLLREVHHRVKNNLQIISGLVYFQSKKVRSKQDAQALDELRQRIFALALVHERLYRSTDVARLDVAGYLRELVDEVSRSHERGQAIRVQLTAAPMNMPVELALPTGLIVCELLTNTFKHAFPHERLGGYVRVGLVSEAGHFALTVEDDGVGFPSDFRPDEGRSFGWDLIQRLVTQLGGTVQLRSSGGAQVRIDFPASR